MHGFAAIAQQRDKANFMTNPAVPASNTVPEMGATQPQHYGSGGGMYGGYMGPQGGGNHGGINVSGMPGQFNSHRVSNKNTNYRDNPVVHNPSQQTQNFMSNFDHLFNDDIAPQPQIDYNYDRIHNELLDEICSDIGIKDSVELDFMDFDPGFNKTWDPSNIKKPGFEDDILDQIIPFGDQERRASGESEPTLGYTNLSEEAIRSKSNKMKLEPNSPVCSPVVHSTSGGSTQGNAPSPISTCSSYQAGTPEAMPEGSPAVTSSSTDTESDVKLETQDKGKLKQHVDQNSNLHALSGKIKEEHPSSTTSIQQPTMETAQTLHSSATNLTSRPSALGMQRSASPVRTCQSMPASITCSPAKSSRAGGRFAVPQSPAKGLLAQTLSARLHSHLGQSPGKKLHMPAPSPSSAGSSPNMGCMGGTDDTSDLATRLCDSEHSTSQSDQAADEPHVRNRVARGLDSPLIDQGYYSVGSPSLPSSQQTAQFGGSVPDILNTGEEKVYTFLEGPTHQTAGHIPHTPDLSNRHRVHQLQGSTRLSPRSASLSLDDIPMRHQRSDIPAMNDLHNSSNVSTNNALSASMPAGLETCSTNSVAKGLHNRGSSDLINQQYGSQASVNSNTSTSDTYSSKPGLAHGQPQQPLLSTGGAQNVEGGYYQQKMLSRTSRAEYSPYQRVQNSNAPKSDNLADAMRSMARATGYNQTPYNRGYNHTSQVYSGNENNVQYQTNSNNNNNMHQQSYNMTNVPMSPSKLMGQNESAMGPSMSQLENQIPDGPYDRFKPIAPVSSNEHQHTQNRMGYPQCPQSKPSPYEQQNMQTSQLPQTPAYNTDPTQQRQYPQQNYQQHMHGQQIQQPVSSHNPMAVNTSSQQHPMASNTPVTPHSMAGNAPGQPHPMMGNTPGQSHPMTTNGPGQPHPMTGGASSQPHPITGMVPGQQHPIAGNPAQVGMPPGQPEIIGDLSKSTLFAHNDLLQRLIADRSSAFRSHPLFPLLRDLIVADMNFHSPSFPFQLIANLPCDFDRLLQNYLSRNPPVSTYRANQAIESVITDALRHAHTTLIEKITQRKQQRRLGSQPKNVNAIEDFCERFDRAVKNTLDQNPEQHTGTNMPHPNIQQSPHMPGHPGMHPGHQFPGGGQFPGQQHPGNMMGHPGANMPGMYPGHMNESMAARINQQRMYGGMMPGMHPMQQPQPATQPTKKHQVLPKEAVAIMLDWLREHQDNPYPNDDEKDMLIHRTRLTINQINYWFTNARRRILPKWAQQRALEEKNGESSSTGSSTKGSTKGSDKSSDKGADKGSATVSTTTSAGNTVIPQSPSSTTNSTIASH